MKARDFIVEYDQSKTAQAFGPKLLTALASDKSHAFGGTALGTARAYLQQKGKLGTAIEPNSTQIIITDILSSLEKADPTPNKEYTQWLAKSYANAGIKMEDLLSRGASALKQYHIFKIKKLLPADYRDIGRIDFNTLESIAGNPGLLQALYDKDDLEIAKNMPKGKSEVIYDDANVRIIHPEDEAAACYYGQGTRWCTAAKNNNMFNNYNRDGPMFILLPKQAKHDGEKYQIHFASNQFMDEDDNSVDIITLLSKRFGDLVPVFRGIDSSIDDMVVFVSDEILVPLLEEIKSIATDFIHEIVSEWEMEDDYYFTWLKDNGYVDEDNDVDWDKAPSYFEYNDEASRIYKKMIDAVDVTPTYARQLAQSYSEDGGGHLLLRYLEDVIVQAIKEENAGWRGRGSDLGYVLEKLSDRISKGIIVSNTGDGTYAVTRSKHI